MIDRTSEREGRWPSDDEKKLRVEIADREGRDERWERQDARKLKGERCNFKATCKNAGDMPDRRGKCVLVVELHKNAARGVSGAGRRCCLAIRSSARVNMTKVLMV
jgi:hypothetical protein